ncbi:MAG: hypothetical protein ACLQME_02490 [Alphaproteobacteria bacterium]
MNPNDIWATPGIPAKGDENEEALYASIGRALSAWEQFEGLLAFLFAAFIIPEHDSEAARRAYGSVVSFTGRADLLKSAAAILFRNFPNEKLQRELGTLLKTARRAAPQRNNIAHGIVQSFHLREPYPKPQQFALFPAYYNTSRHDVWGMPEYAFTKEMVDRFRDQFLKLQEPVESIARELTGLFVWRIR